VSQLVTAFLLLRTKSGSETNVFNFLKKIPEIKELHFIYGVYDIIACLEHKTKKELNDVIEYKISIFEHVQSALTLIIHTHNQNLMKL
jgi:DNA-binding Lrp family transcriptional regulator